MSSLKAMKLSELVEHANKQAEELRNKKPEALAKDDATEKDDEMKGVESALADRIMGKLGYPAVLPPYYGYPYAGPLAAGYPSPYYPYDPETAAAVAAVNGLHGAIVKYEYDNAIAGLVHPSVEAVHHILDTITDTKGMAGKGASDKAAKEDSSFVQLEGEPVGVNPTLVPNDMADADLEQRNYVIDGVNGFDLVQTGDFLSTENDPDYVASDALSTPTAHYPRPRLTTIQADERGAIPVLVHPESMLLPTVTQTGVAYETLFQGNTMVIGPDELIITQLADDVTAPDEDDSVVLQVNGVPVLVHPESMLMPTVSQSGTSSMRIFPTGTITIGADEVSAAQASEPAALTMIDGSVRMV